MLLFVLAFMFRSLLKQINALKEYTKKVKLNENLRLE